MTKYVQYPRQKIMRLLNVESIRAYFTLVEDYKEIVESSHQYVKDRLMHMQIHHEHDTRFRSQLCMTAPLFNKTKWLSSFAYQSVHIWNKLPYEIKIQGTLKLFKKELKIYLTLNQVSII